ncbi:TIGR04282 family arsenosugar biosynthesis glycosyltransferase [Bisbaumannia pacifica]|uniref:TIGR04282 family arsenosugar biosynthesis glycosyltransferase n=1 Tax=Bisbaumannia pacifica TaxID=77098 RepID=A0ABD4KYP0_9GAMM|nr:TIGR04282 family arsenosugar biosynthesis glycosyltransferase [Halomonas pacifica]MBH8579424.1 TIGR04282 family arsenosugar biosynthesis glycosyltransferase [Halomonas pacifica]
MIQLFAKAPLPGQAKTRLIPALGAAGAASLHRRLVWRALATTSEASRRLGLGPVRLWTALDHHHPFFAECRRAFDIDLAPQPEGDLGRRMAAAFAEPACPAPRLLLGSDCPAVTPELVMRCWTALAERDAVFLPAEDGGYGLIGLWRRDAALFADMPWGGDAVMVATRQALTGLGWRWSEPATVWDLDRPAELPRLEALWAREGSAHRPLKMGEARPEALDYS